jgi:hypothetical protein
MGVRNLYLAARLARFLNTRVSDYAAPYLLGDLDFAYSSLSNTSAQFRFYKVKTLLNFNPPHVYPSESRGAVSIVESWVNGRPKIHYALGSEDQTGVAAYLPHITSSPLEGTSSLQIYNDNYRKLTTRIVLNQIHDRVNIRPSPDN